MTRREIINDIVANWRNPEYLKLHGGEMTAQEIRTVRAVLHAVGIQIIESLPGIDEIIGAVMPPRVAIWLMTAAFSAGYFSRAVVYPVAHAIIVGQ